MASVSDHFEVKFGLVGAADVEVVRALVRELEGRHDLKLIFVRIGGSSMRIVGDRGSA